ncbi:chromate transporter [Brevibacillus fluminis]|uniref:Chromate transporter n=1 Tax=Brevibacillus fluminis TaxID=511487 RepID=A0A3M8DFT5_9BACL|nr:chromate transporter [Brevibacillus fluminis]RNB86980.1 chromate transporter [Brevibacillus fluminis]
MNSRMEWKTLWHIFIAFLKISPVTFGGGYAMIPLLEQAFTEKKKWIKKEEIVDILAFSQTVPGSIAVNAATFIGYRLAKVPGAVAATLGMVIPTSVIIVLLAALFLGYQHLPIIQSAFLGIRPAIVALIFYAAVKTGKAAIVDKITVALGAAALIILLFVPIHPVFVLLAGAVIGILLGRSKKKKQNGAASDEEAKREYTQGR